MAPVEDLEVAAHIQLRAAVAVELRLLREGEQHIHFRQGLAGGLDAVDVFPHFRAKVAEELVLQLAGPLIRPQDGALHLLELIGHEPLGVGEGLLAHVSALRYLGVVGLGDFDVVAEDVVVADFEGIDARGLAFARLQFREPVLAVAGSGAQLVQLGVVSVPYHAALLDGDGRFLHHGAQQELRELRKITHALRQGCKDGSLGGQGGQIGGDIRQLLQRGAERQQVTPVSGSLGGGKPGVPCRARP